MSLSSSDLRLFEPATVAADFSTASVGGAMSANELVGSIGEILFEMPSSEDGSGDGDKVQRAKVFYKNKSTDTDLSQGKIWIANALDDFGAGMDTVGMTSSSADDDATMFYRCIGYDVNSDPIVLEVAGDGITQALTVDQVSFLSRVSSHLDDSGSGYPLQAVVGDVTIKRGNGTTLGVIPAGYSSATQEIDLWLAATLGDTATIATAAEDPAGASWSRPRTYATAGSVANSGVLTAETGQAVWLRETIKEGIQPSRDVQVILAIDGWGL